MTVTFEFHGQLLRLVGREQQQLSFTTPVTVESALSALAQMHPELAAALARCACAVGDRLILRRELLCDDTHIALLPPVAGG